MSTRRHPWYALAVLALLLAPFALAARPALAANTYTVDTLTDAPYDPGATTTCDEIASPDCTLRQALYLAEHDGVASQITFLSSLTGEIKLDLVLYGSLTLTEGGTTIEAQINPPAITLPPIEIVPQVANSEPAFTISSAGNTIKGLSITGFTGFNQPQGGAVLISGSGATGNVITSNYIGVKPNGTTLGANLYGVRIEGDASSNTVSNNIIVGSLISGVLINNASSNTLTSNLIGIGLNSTTLPNDTAGIEVSSFGSGASTGNIIGGTSAQANFISSNGPAAGTSSAGILIRAAGTTGTKIYANLIGTDISGSTDLGNNGDGIRISSGAKNTQIVGDNNAPVVISGNSNYGIRITGAGTTGTQIGGGVFIGLNRNRNAALPNAAGGIWIDQGASATTMTGSAGALTLIGGNTGPGVLVEGSSTTGNQVGGAYIGAVPNPATTGTIALPNTGGGVLVQGGAQKTTISGNTISGNAGFGVRLSATKTVTITGNYIGLGTSLNATVNNAGPGIDVQAGSTGTLIGAPGAGNYIAGNTGDGIAIAGTGTISTTVQNNVIGLLNTAANGGGSYTVSGGNTGNGVQVSAGATKTTVSGNTIASHAGGDGIRLSGVTTATLSSNYLGYVDGVTPAARANRTGITLNAVTGVDVLTNTVKYNSGSGILATDVQTVTLRANTVANQLSGDGITVNGASNRVKVYSNTLTTNSGYGVLVDGTAQRVTIQYNNMKLNGAGGVRLAGTTKGLGAETDTAGLPNHGIDPPIYDPANDPSYSSPLRFRLDQQGNFTGYVYTDTLRVSSCLPTSACRIQFFAAAPDDTVGGQGYTPLRVQSSSGTGPFVSPDAQGRFSGTLVLTTTTLPKQLLFAATDGQGNTSEFGVLNIDVRPPLAITYRSTADGQQTAKPGDVVTYTLNLENNGSLKLANVAVVTTGSIWPVSPAKGSLNYLTLDEHSSRVFTVTLTLPTGSDERVLAGTKDYTSLFAQVTGKITPVTISKIMTTTVAAAPVISGQLLSNTFSARPTEPVTQTYRFTNSGNVSVTLNLDAETLDPALSNYVWNPTPSVGSLTLTPGQSSNIQVITPIPQGAPTINPSTGQPFIVTTVVTATSQAPYPGYNAVVSGTVGVDLAPSVQMYGTGDTVQAASYAEVTFRHTVVNTSNGPATFCLNWRSYSGSSVRLFRTQNNVAINPTTGCFSLGTSQTTNYQIFEAVIRVTGTLLPKDTDQVEIFLTNPSGQVIPNSTVVDNIEITVSPLLPRIWIPIAIK